MYIYIYHIQFTFGRDENPYWPIIQENTPKQPLTPYNRACKNKCVDVYV